MRKESRNLLNYSINFFFFCLLFSLIPYFSVKGDVAIVEYASQPRTKSNHLFHARERYGGIQRVDWISANRIALWLESGLIEICQIDEEIVIDSRVIKQFEHGNRKYASLRISTILFLQLCAAGGRTFCFSFVEGFDNNMPEME